MIARHARPILFDLSGKPAHTCLVTSLRVSLAVLEFHRGLPDSLCPAVMSFLGVAEGRR